MSLVGCCGILLIALGTGCSDSSKLGRYYQGKVLHVSVAEIERSGAISFSTVNPEGLISVRVFFHGQQAGDHSQ